MFTILSLFKQELIEDKPTLDQMKRDIISMNFKIVPRGAIKKIQFNNPLLIELLWLIGKVDTFLLEEADELGKKEREAIENFVQLLWHKVQGNYTYTPLPLTLQDLLDDNDIVDLEVYRDNDKILN